MPPRVRGQPCSFNFHSSIPSPSSHTRHRAVRKSWGAAVRPGATGNPAAATRTRFPHTANAAQGLVAS